MTEPYVITLDPAITLATIEPFCFSCCEAAQSEKDVTVNASQVERLCTPVFQLLASLELTVRKNGHNFIIEQPSEAFLTMQRFLGFESVFSKKKEV